MAVDRETLERLRAQYREWKAENRAPEDDPLSALSTLAELLGFVASTARFEGLSDEDAADHVEIVASLAGIPKDELRSAARVLKKLRYDSVADRLRELARKARKSPPPYWCKPPRHRDAMG